jgi:Protein of unknown function (DUF1579)
MTQTTNKEAKQIMKHSIRYFGSAFVAAGALALVAGLALAGDKAQKLDPKMEEMMKKAEAACTPGPAHKALEPLVGDWNAEVKMWMSQDAPPTITKGTAKSTWTLKDRFVREEFSGEFMGKPFRGISFTGYDNVRQKYRSVWLDDMSTTMITSEGEADSAGKVITLGGDYSCAMSGEGHKTCKQVFRILSRDKHVFEMYDPAQGDAKTMEITYTRK